MILDFTLLTRIMYSSFKCQPPQIAHSHGPPLLNPFPIPFALLELDTSVPEAASAFVLPFASPFAAPSVPILPGWCQSISSSGADVEPNAGFEGRVRCD